ncbi:recombination mediator RecR [Candidatus Dependentiae bacterium]|nr:recombination mediator RecR [Candidatus Dependentiae bacterium]MBU4387566.1 recombination mediator RecR [Candidatus Dependentiae bacterium]MCG2756641.1 recombination mediator RecR [Candidatus Dependentiae bacterium]
MFNDLPTLQKIVRQLQRIPYLASKNVYRVALHLLQEKPNEIEQLFDSISNGKKQIHKCEICFNLVENNNKCSICSSQNRDLSVICVVENWYDLQALERAGGYNGVFHVLEGSLCPLEGVGPDDINIDALFKRINDSTKEIIFATNLTPEGEATASFISSKVEELGLNLQISRLASGVPIGSSLEYMDRVTIYKALSGRRPF